MSIPWADLAPDEQLVAARFSPAHLSQLLNPERRIPAHVLHMNKVVTDAVARGLESRDGEIVVVMMPPGHIKSDTCSVHLPLWFLERHPAKNVALASYGHDKALEWGRIVRNTIQENPETFLVRLSPDSKAANRWNTEAGGGMLCTGIGGPLTGFRAHLLIVDDPVKDDVEAQSETTRERHWQWFRKVALTRCWPEATVLVVMTRWHEDDLVGRLLALDKQAESDQLERKKLTVIRFPCLAEGEDVLGRSEGEALWPDGGYDETWAAKIKTAVGSHAWAGLYQQRPAPAGGGMFQRSLFRYCRQEGDHYVLLVGGSQRRVLVNQCWIAQTVDTAMKAKEGADWTVVLTFAVTPTHDLLLLRIVRERIDVPQQWTLVCAERDRIKNRGNYRWSGIEDKGSGTALLQTAKQRGIPFRPLEAGSIDKVTRATQAAVHYENGGIYHLLDAPWLEAFESELVVFPNGLHDDQVDVLAYAARSVGEAGSLLADAPPSKPLEEREPAFGDMTPKGGPAWQ